MERNDNRRLTGPLAHVAMQRVRRLQMAAAKRDRGEGKRQRRAREKRMRRRANVFVPRKQSHPKAPPKRLLLTQELVDQMVAPATRTTIWDTRCIGLGFRISPTEDGGRYRVWVCQYRRNCNPVYVTFAKCEDATLDQARETVREIRTKVSEGFYPRRLMQRPSARELPALAPNHDPVSFAALVHRFFSEYVEIENAPATIGSRKSIMGGHLLPAFGDIRMDQLKPVMVRDFIRRKKADGYSPAHINQMYGVLKSFIRWVLLEDEINGTQILPIDPLRALKQPFPPAERERVLDKQEIIWYWRAAEMDGYPYGYLFQLLLLTAQRVSEVRCLPYRGE